MMISGGYANRMMRSPQAKREWGAPVTARALAAWDEMAKAAPDVALGQIDWPMIVKALIGHIRSSTQPGD